MLCRGEGNMHTCVYMLCRGGGNMHTCVWLGLNVMSQDHFTGLKYNLLGKAGWPATDPPVSSQCWIASVHHHN